MYNLPEMPSVHDREIIIIGAGPAGSSAAYDLARAGRRPLLLEKDRVPGEKNACAGGIPYLMKDHLNLPPEVIDKEIHVTRLSCRGKTKDYRTPRPQYISVQRRVFDRFLAFRARDAGAELLTSHLVTRVEPRGNIVMALDLKRKEEVSFRAPLILFADGPLTRARSSFGLGCSVGEMVASVAYELAAPGNREEAFEFYFGGERGRDASGYFWNFPKKDSLNVGMGRMKRFVKKPLAEELQGFIDRHPRFRGKPILRKQAGLIPMKMAPRFSGEGALLLGDAAGLVNPLTGGGLIYAIASGEIAALAARQALEARSFRAEDLYDAYDRAFRRTNYWRWLRLMAIPYRFVERRTEKGLYSWYPEILRAFLAVSFLSLRLLKKL